MTKINDTFTDSVVTSFQHPTENIHYQVLRFGGTGFPILEHSYKDWFQQRKDWIDKAALKTLSQPCRARWWWGEGDRDSCDFILRRCRAHDGNLSLPSGFTLTRRDCPPKWSRQWVGRSRFLVRHFLRLLDFLPVLCGMQRNGRLLSNANVMIDWRRLLGGQCWCGNRLWMKSFQVYTNFRRNVLYFFLVGEQSRDFLSYLCIRPPTSSRIATRVCVVTGMV